MEKIHLSLKNCYSTVSPTPLSITAVFTIVRWESKLLTSKLTLLIHDKIKTCSAMTKNLIEVHYPELRTSRTPPTSSYTW